MNFSVTYKIKAALAACLACIMLVSCGTMPDDTIVSTKPDTTESTTAQTTVTASDIQTTESTTVMEVTATTEPQTTPSATTIAETTTAEPAAPSSTEQSTTKTTAETTSVPLTESPLSLVSVTSPAQKGDSATATVRGKANTEYTIKVYYSSGASKAKGLDPTVAGADGTVSWTWKVGVNTKPGTYRIVVSGGSETLEFHFDVVE